MRTCRFFYHQGAISLLQDRVELTDDQSILRFLNFLEAGDEPRFPYVRNISFRIANFWVSPIEIRNRIVKAVSRMTGLISLSIRDAGRTLKTWPGFGDALATLTSLRRIKLHGGGPTMVHLLSSLSRANRLLAIDVDWTLRREENEVDGHGFFHTRVSPDAWPSMHPVPFLSHCAPTLEELSCRRWHTHPGPGTPVYAEVYPRMRRLQIVHDSHPVAAHYIRAFPNLTSLHLWTNQDVITPTVPLLPIRNMNMLMQYQLGLDSAASCWPHLETYTGSLTHLYALCLSCHIPMIRFDEGVSDAHLPMLMDVLSRAQPVHLKFYGQGVILDHPTHSLASVLQYVDGAARLESLAVGLTLMSRVDRDMDVDGRLDELATMLARIPVSLRRLRLRIVDEQAGHSSATTRSQLERLAEAVPTLADAVVVVDGRWINIRVARVPGHDPDSSPPSFSPRPLFTAP
ncbi:hypothetical protein C8Q76DRAFT_800321 [Earliella scabrosa]|nr:hypothetical protein C8Q76DRAFT_800321 [Earliella scabrosa]